MKDPDLDALMDRIRECCRAEATIVAAYLFGSAATGRMREKSDIDVAVLVSPGHEEGFPFLEFAASLEKACACRVDLVLLNRAGEILKYQVRRYGRLIFERDSKKRKQFEVTSRKQFEDFLYLHERYARKVLYKT